MPFAFAKARKGEVGKARIIFLFFLRFPSFFLVKELNEKEQTSHFKANEALNLACREDGEL